MANTASSEETKALGTALAQQLAPGTVLVLTGDLGAGKTQFTQGLAAGLGIAGTVVSPTFNILLTYSDGRLELNHFDLYRLEEEEELEDTGYYDALDAGGVCIIEWGDRFPDALPEDYLAIDITADTSELRTLRAWAVGDCAGVLQAWAQAAGLKEMPE